MIAFIKGRLAEATPLRALVDVSGVGYEIAIPLTTAEKLPPVGETVLLHTLAIYREDSASLYGFHSSEEKVFFQMLIEKVSGVGPKMALSLLSRLSVATLKEAISRGDTGTLSRCPGIGKKTAERLIIELRDKLGVPASETAGPSPSGVFQPVSLPTADATPFTDAVAALVALGYKAADAEKSVRKAAQLLGASATTESLIRNALS